MSKHKVYIYFLVVSFSLFAACEKFTEQEKFNRPDWLPGKLFTTVSAQENLSLFAECLQLSGLDSILDVSGSWTVFAPTNEAMQQFLLENNYASVSAIPLTKLEKIAEFHVIQNPWSFEQLQNLSAFGWRTKDDGNLNSYAFKRETILKNPIEKYWIKNEDKNEMIVTDSLSSQKFKKVFVESRKYAPVFYDKFMSVSATTSADYRFYFNRDYEPGNVFFAGAKIIESDIFAENGFVHIVDRVATPMLNAEEMLERIIPGESYQLFLQLVYWYFPSFEANLTATFNQAAVSYGGHVDTLWDLHYSNLAFDIHKEQIGYQGGNVNETLVRHNGMFAPTDNAFRGFVDDILTQKSGFPHWRDYQSLPNDIVNIILSRHFQSTPIYPSKSQYQNIFRAVGNKKIHEGDIIRKKFGSN